MVDKLWANVLLKKVSEPASVLGQSKLTPNRTLVRKLDFRRWIKVCNCILARENEGRTATLQENTTRDQRSSAMVSFLVELWLAKHADVDLRSYLIGVFGFMLAVPTADRFYVVTEVGEELLPGRGYVSAESSGVVVSSEEDEMIQL